MSASETPESGAGAAEERYDRLLGADPADVAEAVAGLFGEQATAAYAYELLTVDVPAASWTTALETARDRLGCTYFDWLSAVDEPGIGFLVSAHVAALGTGTVRRLLLRTTVPHDAAVLPSAIDVYAGAAWHERETHEMFGIGFEGHPHLVPLLLPEGFEGHPLRKDFVLAARVAKAWPGAKEPGESEHGGPKRRTMLPPGVPDPNEWGPLKGQLPPAPARPARGARAAATGDRPVRRARSVAEGSAGQRPAAPAQPDAPATGQGGDGGPGATAAATEGAPPARPARRSRSVSAGSASQRAEGSPSGTPEAPSAGVESPSAGVEGGSSGTETPATGPGASAGAAPRRPAGSADAPWHHARPAFDDAAAEAKAKPEPEAAELEPEAAKPEAEAAKPEPPEPAEPAKPAETTDSAEPAEPADSAEPAETEDPDVSPDPAHRPSGGDTA